MNHCRPPQNWSLECGAVQIAARQKSSQTTDGQYLIRFCKVLYRTLVTPRPTQRFIPSSPYVATTIQSVAPLEYADAAFAPGSPFLAVAEPALLLFPLAFGALGGAIGYGDALDTFFLRLRFILVGVES